MLLAHAVNLAEARSYLAALADNAHTFEAVSEYEGALLDLDALHGGDVPPLSVESLTTEPDILYAVAESAIEELLDHGVDSLRIELILARIERAQALDRP